MEEIQDDTGTEEEGINEPDDENYDSQEDGPFAVGKGWQTKWSLKPPYKGQTQRIGIYYNFLFQGSLAQPARPKPPLLSVGVTFVTDNIIEIIVNSTNKFIDSIKEKYSQAKDIIQLILLRFGRDSSSCTI